MNLHLEFVKVFLLVRDRKIGGKWKNDNKVYMSVSQRYKHPYLYKKNDFIKDLLLLLNCILATEAHEQKNPSYHVTQKAIRL